MKNVNATSRLPMVLAFAVLLLSPSFDTALKYFGPGGVAGYFLIGTVSLLLAYRFIVPIYYSLISERAASYLAIATFVLLTATAVYLYPIANSGRFGGGSDADEALITAANELIRGRYPYYLTTYLGNLISPMPGTVILAIPFVVVGMIHLQNIFWLAVFFVVYRKFENSGVSALGLLWTVLLFSPTVLQNIVTGADYTSNSLYILVLMWILTKVLSDPTAPEWKRLFPAILLGIGLSSRSTFILLTPLLLSVLLQTSGWKKAFKYLSVAGSVFLIVTVPFWLYDPAGFAPLTVQSTKLKAIDDLIPFASAIIPGSAVILSTLLSLRKLERDCSRFFLYCAIVQLYVLMLTSLIYTIKQGQLDLYLGQTGYGMFTLFFGAVASWMYLYGEHAEGPGGGAEFVGQT